MARDWYDLFLVDGGAPAPAPDEPERQEERRGFFKRMRENMRKTREALQAEVQATLFQGDLDEETWERLEEALIYADVGAKTTAEVVERLEREAESGELVGGGAAEEATVCLRNLSEVCRSAGARLEDAVRLTVYLADLVADAAAVNDVYASFFSEVAGALPARAAVGVTALPRGARVMIDAVVALPD